MEPEEKMAMAVPDEMAGLRRGLGRDGLPIPAYQTLGLAFRSATAGAAVVRLPVSEHLAPPAGGLLPGAFAVRTAGGGLWSRKGR